VLGRWESESAASPLFGCSSRVQEATVVMRQPSTAEIGSVASPMNLLVRVRAFSDVAGSIKSGRRED
jgi:hypothetical protein